MVVFLLGFYLLSACIDSFASEHNKMRTFKIFLVPTLIAILSCCKDYDIVLLIALALCWIGDIYLIEKTKKNVQNGMIAFLFAHIMYCVHFMHIPSFTNYFFWIGLVGYIIGFIVYLKTIFKDVEKGNQKATLIYMSVLFLMSFLSFSKMLVDGNVLSWVGTIFFVLSDMLISQQYSLGTQQLGVMETYSIAQLLIVLGAMYGTTL